MSLVVGIVLKEIKIESEYKAIASVSALVFAVP